MPRDPDDDLREPLAEAARRAEASRGASALAAGGAATTSFEALRPSAVLDQLQRENVDTVEFTDGPGTVGEEDDTTGAVPRPDDESFLASRYLAEEEIGRGGMGVVVRAWDTELRRHVAVKLIHADLPVGRLHLAHFLAEAQLTAQLDHPTVVPVHDVGVTREGQLFYVMKLVRGSTLASVLRRRRLGLRGVVGQLLRAMEGITYAHSRGVVHRDLKPSNLIVGDFGEVWVVDWGVARIVPTPDEPDLTALAADRPTRGGGMGTPAYASPEQLAGAAVSPASDVWSLGAILFEALTGHPPHGDRTGRELLEAKRAGAPDPRSVRPDVPGELAEACLAALAPDPTRRPTVQALAERLDAWLTRLRQREQDRAAWGRRHLELAALAVESRARRIEDALRHLAHVSRLLLEAPVAPGEVDRWIDARGFEVDSDGFFQPRGLVDRIRSRAAPPEALCWSWPPSRAHDPVARRHMYALREIGPALLEIRARFDALSFLYFIDATNVALVFPADDQAAAVPSEFDFLGYPAFAGAAPASNPDLGPCLTPPHVDYGNQGLITAMSLPVTTREGFVGVWGADVPLEVLHRDVEIAGRGDDATFIVSSSGLLIAHPDHAAVELPKGSVLTRSLSELAGPLGSLDVRALTGSAGEVRLSGRAGTGGGQTGEIVVQHHLVRHLDWRVCMAHRVGAE